MQETQEIVQQTIVRVEDPLPHQRNGHNRANGRKEEHQPEEVSSLDLLVQQKGDKQRYRHPDRHAQRCVECIPQGLPNKRIMKQHPVVVVRADELGRSAEIILRETDI
ncbi:hypothetical protein D3C71_1101340 [compost metagenome]